MKPRTYATPAAFKAALEQRLRNSSTSSVDLSRRRQLLVFYRFLARVTRVLGKAAMLKGGLVLELRLERARTTRDVDLRLDAPPEDTLARLQEAGRADLGDFMTFEIQADAQQPEMDFHGTRENGFRYRAECRLAGQIYGQRFGVDVAFADPVLGGPDVVVAEDVLAFAGIEPPRLRLYPVETHLAEKVHVYTLPRDRPNSRVKDLPDVALLGTIRSLEATRVRKALQQTFSFRKTHEVPESLSAPPAAWARPYARMAEDDELPWGLWAEVDAAAFQKYLDAFKVDARGQPPVTGRVANSPQVYPSLEGHGVNLHFGTPSERPTMKLHASTHPLSLEQQRGIPMTRVHEINDLVHGKRSSPGGGA